jgi:hypothetical protein
MLVLSFVFGMVLGDRSGGSQFPWVLLLLCVWWIGWRLAGLTFDVRM